MDVAFIVIHSPPSQMEQIFALASRLFFYSLFFLSVSRTHMRHNLGNGRSLSRLFVINSKGVIELRALLFPLQCGDDTALMSLLYCTF